MKKSGALELTKFIKSLGSKNGPEKYCQKSAHLIALNDDNSNNSNNNNLNNNNSNIVINVIRHNNINRKKRIQIQKIKLPMKTNLRLQKSVNGRAP